ncbi:hypothetical protein ABE29_20660, partial [Cytobacillus firmus]|nr:hypothetical protein [Cytobacillus firmus]MBG9553968.1 hypothetical protein [Cytobacillus firmus]MBG9559065.1 hypothetical protein [Cytobacillus firmus]MBG9559067.1 hypothetical protein [Cytobacillus firmus]MBG9576913.1 hypothetical protein [Cytobacillus firmus]
TVCIPVRRPPKLFRIQMSFNLPTHGHTTTGMYIFKVKHALIGGLGALWQKIGPKTAETDLSVSYMDERNIRRDHREKSVTPLWE